MISKEEFIKIINKIIKFHEAENKIYEGFSILSTDFTGMLFDEEEQIIIELLQNIFEDNENNWISYALYEINDFKDYEDGCVKFDGINMSLRNAEDLYNILTYKQHEAHDDVDSQSESWDGSGD